MTIDIGNLNNHTISPRCGPRRQERIPFVIRLVTYNSCWLGFINSGDRYAHSYWLHEAALRLSRRCQLPIVLNSRQERTVLATISPSHRETYPYNDHGEHNALHVKLTKRSNRRRRAQSHNDWGCLLKFMSNYGWYHWGKNIPHISLWNEPSYETNRRSIG